MIKQLRLRLDTLFIKAILLGGFLLSLFLSSPARAESASEYLQSLAPFSFATSGAALIPTPVLTSLTQGSVSPVVQYILVNNIITSAVTDGINHTPDARLPYADAVKQYEKGICTITKSFQTGLVVSLLAETRQFTYNGKKERDAGTRQMYKQIALSMAQAFAKEKGCDENNSDSGFNVNIIQVLSSLKL